MTDEELSRSKSIEGMSDEEKLRFFTVMRRMHGAEVTVYNADDTSLLYKFTKSELKDIAPSHGLLFNLVKPCPRVVLAHIQVGAWEFWQDVTGQEVGEGRQYAVSLP